MTRVPFSNVLLLNLKRRYTVAPQNLNKERTIVSNIRKFVESSSSPPPPSSTEGVEKDIFWMRDPKTGNWIPETHFDTIDAVELRDKFLPTSRKFTRLMHRVYIVYNVDFKVYFPILLLFYTSSILYYLSTLRIINTNNFYLYVLLFNTKIKNE